MQSTSTSRARRDRTGFTLRELLVCIFSLAILIGALTPTLGAMRNGDQIAVSMNNLRIIFEAHMTYAGDFNGRQLTYVPDNLSEILNFGSYPHTYATGGSQAQVPSVPIGFDCKGNYYSTRRGWAVQPYLYAGNCSLGNFRSWNFQPIHQYVNGRTYDETFWAPKDPIPKIHNEIREYWELRCEWPGQGTTFFFPTYCRAVSAQYDSRVYANDDIGQIRPIHAAEGHRTPPFVEARYPDLKTFMLEHWWLQDPPKDPYIPGTKVPYYFNASEDSAPVTLFFDGQVRLMKQLEATTSDKYVQRSGAPSLVAARDAGCFGNGGYFNSYAYNGEDISSYHVFTADGILGRDTIFASHDAGGKRDPR